MKTAQRNRIVSILLVFAFLFSFAGSASASDSADGFRCEKSAVPNGDGTYRISLRAFQTGSVPAADIVMVLDVSGSMENSTPVPVDEIDSAKDYYIRYIRKVETDGETKYIRVNVRVHNTAAEGETPAWFGQLDAEGPEREVIPGDGSEGTYQFYTGAMDALRAAASEFVHSIAQNAAEYEADHRIAVVEFSSPEPKGADALCTHTTQPDPYYASILSGDGTASGALVSAKDSEQALTDVFASLKATGPTYSDDAMTQARRILSASAAERRAVILFTDGGPGSYGWDYDNDATALPTANGAISAAAELKRGGAQIYTIGVFNAENLAGTAGEKNRKYLSYVSSNYPDAASMENPGTQQADGFCSIGDLHMDLSGAFAGISAVLGEPVKSAQVCDTVSKYFYLTDAQRQALLEAYPQVQITENGDGTTTVSLDSVDFPPVATHANGDVADENDAGIFTLTFDVTPREGFLGGDGVSTNSGKCGVFTGSMQIGEFATPSVDVPVNLSVLGSLLTVLPQTLYAGATLSADSLYIDRSHEEAAEFAAVSYTATDPDGVPFTQLVMQTPGNYTFTVSVCAKNGDQTVTQQKDVTVTVEAVKPVRAVAEPAQKSFTYKTSPDFTGLSVRILYNDGHEEIETDLSKMKIEPQSASRVRRGPQTFRVTTHDISTTFTMESRLVWWQWLILIVLFGWIWY